MGDNAPANVSFKSNLPFIKGSLHAEAVFERAQARLNACSPALTTPEPALFLSCRSAGAQAAAGWQNHLLDSQLHCCLFVGAAPEASVSRSQSGRLTEQLHMGLERRHPLLLIAKVAWSHSKIANKPVFDFVNPDQAPKFIGLVSLALADDYTVSFKEAQDFVRMPCLGLENAGPTLGDDLLNQRQVVLQRSFCCQDLQASCLPGH
jgi:hypothetical protein